MAEIHVEQRHKEAIHEMARVGTDETLEGILTFWVGQAANSGGDLFTKDLVERVFFDDNIDECIQEYEVKMCLSQLRMTINDAWTWFHYSTSNIYMSTDYMPL